MPIAVHLPEEYVIPVKPLFAGSDVIPVRFPIRLENIYGQTMWFKLLIVNPPTGWTVTEAYLGSVSAYGSAWRLAGLAREVPSLTNGEYAETLTMRIEIYSDENYSNLIDAQNFNYNLRFIDPTDPSWILVDHDNFEWGLEGWILSPLVADPSIRFASTGTYPPFTELGVQITTEDSIEGSASLTLVTRRVEETKNKGVMKYFDGRWFQRSYIIVHIRPTSVRTAVRVGDEIVLPASASDLIKGTWTAIAMKAPKRIFPVIISAETVGATAAGTRLAYIDAVYMVAKQS